MFAWIMESPIAVDLLKKWSADYTKMDCKGNKCYGVLAVRVISLHPSQMAQVIHCNRYTGYALRLQSFTPS